MREKVEPLALACFFIIHFKLPFIPQPPICFRNAKGVGYHIAEHSWREVPPFCLSIGLGGFSGRRMERIQDWNNAGVFGDVEGIRKRPVF